MRVDRSFAAAPPPCLAELTPARVEGESWGSVTLNLTTEVAARDRCLRQVAAWLESERKARDSGAAGS